MVSQVIETKSAQSADDRASGRFVPSIAIVASNSRRPSQAVLILANGASRSVSID